MADFVLFGTAACHLCEEAEQLLFEANIAFDKSDIIDDLQLQQRYAVRIPVLLHTATERELGWPFTSETLLEFVSNVHESLYTPANERLTQ